MTASRGLLFLALILPVLLSLACSSPATGADGDVDIPDYDGGPLPDGDRDDVDQDGAPLPDGDAPADGDASVDGDQTDGDLPDGDSAPDGDLIPDGDSPADGDIPSDGDAPDGDAPDGDLVIPVYQSAGTPYEPGQLEVVEITVNQGDSGAPVSMLVVTPTAPDDYAVVVFQHGFLMANRWYSELLRFVASHGFVVVAPQMYAANGIPVGKPSAWEEAGTAAQVYDWLDANLADVAGVQARTQRLGLAGHSRGGKVIWIVLSSDPTRARAVAGVDPVDGQGGPLGGEARVINGNFGFLFPSLVIGTGLGPTGLSPCAPTGDNHIQFYAASAPTAFHHVATEFGHNDMLNENPDGCGLVCTACAAYNGTKSPMVTYTAGILSAFFRWTLQDDIDMLDYMVDAEIAPVTIEIEHK
jgi:chlorophyllase